MNKFTDEQHEAARQRFAERLHTAPGIKSAIFEKGRLTLELQGSALEGAVLSFPLRAIPELAQGSEEQLGAFEVTRSGNAMRWRDLDVGISAASLVQLATGLKSVSANAAKAGATRTEAKSEAARANGAKGGRPRKKPIAV